MTKISKMFETDETKWAAVRSRDPTADGVFVFAVRTTHIYCRPTCSARLARRANVSFFDSSRSAEAHNFRACKRCKPEVQGAMPDGVAAQRIRAFLAQEKSLSALDGEGGARAERKMSLDEMARRTGVSKWHFHRVFKKVIGVSPAQYASSRQRSDENERNALHESSTPRSEDLALGLEDFGRADYMDFIWSEVEQWEFASLLSGAPEADDSKDIPSKMLSLGMVGGHCA
jgi:methylphosphotriester-DNA--protein-cysteine methyltransferase